MVVVVGMSFGGRSVSDVLSVPKGPFVCRGILQTQTALSVCWCVSGCLVQTHKDIMVPWLRVNNVTRYH